LAALAALLTALPSFFSVLREVFSAPAPGAFGFAFFRLSRPEPIYSIVTQCKKEFSGCQQAVEAGSL